MVCGRTPDELDELLDGDVEIVTHQNISKCTKCRDEYLAETQDEEVEQQLQKQRNWKELATA